MFDTSERLYPFTVKLTLLEIFKLDTLCRDLGLCRDDILELIVSKDLRHREHSLPLTDPKILN